MNIACTIKEILAQKRDSERIKVSAYFFKTGVGEYGEGDVFWGIRVPDIRSIVQPYALTATPDDIRFLLHDSVHECRLAGGLLMVKKYELTKEERARQEVVEFYCTQLRQLNNWDLVDLTCYKILGHWLLNHDRSILYRLAESDSLWEQRVAIVSTMTLIKKRGETADTYTLAERLLSHSHDLIHKAVGWLLREAGKEDEARLRSFIDQHYTNIPRTTLRYAIEKFPSQERKAILSNKKNGQNA